MSKVWKSLKPPFAQHKELVFRNAAKVSALVFQIGESDNLRIPSKEVLIKNIKTSQMQQKFTFLKKCLKKYTQLTGHGRGMAAVQVGIHERFFAVYTKPDKTKIEIIINPKIIKKSSNLMKYPEMCMSANPVIVPLARTAWIEFSYYDEDGKVRKWDAKDHTDLGRMLNRVFQHEIDHLEGIINIDLVNSPKELILESDPDFYKKAKFEKV